MNSLPPDLESSDVLFRPWWRRYRPVILVAAAGLVLGFAAAHWFAREARRLDEARFQELVNATVAYLDQRVEATEALLRALARELSASPTPSLAKWDEFMNQASPQWNFPGVMAIGYATNTATAATIDRLNAWIMVDPARARENFYSLPKELEGPKSWLPWILEIYREPLQPLIPFGQEVVATGHVSGVTHFRRFTDPSQAALVTKENSFHLAEYQGSRIVKELVPDSEWILQAVFRDEVKITGREPVLRDAAGTEVHAVTMIVPTYAPDRTRLRELLAPVDNLYSPYWLRWNLNQGVVMAQLDFAALTGSRSADKSHPLRVEIHAASTNEVSIASWLNPDGPSPWINDPKQHPAFATAYSWPMYGTRWTLYLHTTSLFDAQSTRYRSYWAMGWVWMASGLICWILVAQIRARGKEQSRLAQLAEARDALQAVQRQRERMSADLHDGAIQSLYAVQLGLTETAREVKDRVPRAAGRLAESRMALDVVIGDLREFIGQLAGPGAASTPVDLTTAMEGLIGRFRIQTQIPIELVSEPTAGANPSPIQTVQLLGIASSALSNSVRHSSARHIAVTVVSEKEGVVLTVEDDGCGFEPADTKRQGLGLRTMQNRARELGARLEIKSESGKGTRVRVELPLPNPGEEAID